MAEAHQPALAALHAGDELRDPVHRADLAQHAQDRFVRPAVQRAVQRRRGAGERREGIGLRAADAAHRAGAAVLLVVGVQDEQHVERAFEDRVRLPGLALFLVEHAQEGSGVAEAGVGRDVRASGAAPAGAGGHAGRERDQPGHLRPAGLRVAHLFRFGEERGERADAGQEHPHRVGALREAAHQRPHVRVERGAAVQGVAVDLGRPGVELGRRRQFAVDQQPGRFEKGAALGELLDRIAAISKDAPVAVDERDPAAATGRVEVRRVVRQHPKLVGIDLDLAEVERADRAVDDRDLVLPARAVVGDGQRIAHACLSLPRIARPAGPGARFRNPGRRRSDRDPRPPSIRSAPGTARRSSCPDRGAGNAHCRTAAIPG